MRQAFHVTREQDEFFASSVEFYCYKTGKKETALQSYYRHEIWGWMEKSLSKGDFAWIAPTIVPVYDIRKYYHEIMHTANKPTVVSHALAFMRCFELKPVEGDMLKFYGKLIKQLTMLRTQGAEIGVHAHVPKWMLQALLLIAAYKLPQYRTMAVKYTVKHRQIDIRALLDEFNQYKLVGGHLKQAIDATDTTAAVRVHEIAAEPEDVNVYAAAAPVNRKSCFAFQKGNCKRGETCKYSHTAAAKPPQQSQEAKAKPKTGGGNASTKCKRCGQAGPHSTCSYQGTCNFCKKKGHTDAVCRTKNATSKTSANASIVLTARACSHIQIQITWSLLNLLPYLF